MLDRVSYCMNAYFTCIIQVGIESRSRFLSKFNKIREIVVPFDLRFELRICAYPFLYYYLKYQLNVCDFLLHG